MSSPMQNTVGSFSLSSQIPWRMASSYVSCIVRFRVRLDERVILHRVRGGRSVSGPRSDEDSESARLMICYIYLSRELLPHSRLRRLRPDRHCVATFTQDEWVQRHTPGPRQT